MWWDEPLDEDSQHARYDPNAVASYFTAATRAALVLGPFRAPYRGRSSALNAWWGAFEHDKAAFYAYAYPAPDGYASISISPAAAYWDKDLGEYLLDWDDVVASPDPHGSGLEFARYAFQHSCTLCGWDLALPASVEGNPPPIS